MFLAKKSLCPQKSQKFPMFLAKKSLCLQQKKLKISYLFCEKCHTDFFWQKTQEIFNFFEDIKIFQQKTCKIFNLNDQLLAKTQEIFKFFETIDLNDQLLDFLCFQLKNLYVLKKVRDFLCFQPKNLYVIFFAHSVILCPKKVKDFLSFL